MLYQLYQNKLINSLDDPLTKYAPDFKIIDPFGKMYIIYVICIFRLNYHFFNCTNIRTCSDGSDGITLRQMASQLSGLQREAPCNATEENLCPQTTLQILASLSKNILIKPPWTEPSYR